MKYIHIRDTLIYLDAPLVSWGVDDEGLKYVVMQVENRTESDVYLACGLSESRWQALMSGEIDLRSVFIEPEGKVETAEVSRFCGRIGFEPVSSLTEAWLPEPGFFMEPNHRFQPGDPQNTSLC